MIRFLVLLPLLLTIHVAGFVRDGAVEINFPQSIRFSVNLTIPATRITSATLTLIPQGGSAIAVPVYVGAASIVYGEPQARLIYTWPIPADAQLPLFGKVDYVWTFTTFDGSRGTLSDSFVFSDPRFEWVRSPDATGHFSVTAPRSLSLLIEPLRQLHALLEKNTGRTLTYNLILYDQPSGCGYSDLTSQVASSSGCLSLFSGYQVLERPPGVNAETFFVSALVRDAYAPLWVGKDVPAWFVAGLGQFYAPTPKNALQPPAQAAARTNTLFSLSDMRVAQSSSLWQAQSFGMILYIADTITLRGLFDLAHVDADSFAAAYQSAMGTPITALIPAWKQWLFTAAAASGYGITPYQPPTPTPTPTLTPSPTFTATSTPSLTPSLTPTPTLTPLGIRTYVPPPTVTRGPTDTPPPPSITPRPPGSLPTLTATPTALQVTVAQPAFQAGVGTFFVLLLLLVLFLLVRMGNKR